jgi:hypothetical protein
MPRKTKDAPGRVTPKGGTAKRGGPAGRGGPSPAGTTSGRYTAPIPNEYRSSPWWVPVLILVFFGLGILVILLNYLPIHVLPGQPSNWYLFIGLGFIVAGFISATRYH